MILRSEEERRKVWFGVAHAVAEASHCVRSKVGAVIVVNEFQTFVGWNDVQGIGVPCDLGGCPRGGKTMEELPSGSPFTGDGWCASVHAEIMAATLYFRRYKLVNPDVMMYSTREPCENCWDELDRMGFMRSQIAWEK